MEICSTDATSTIIKLGVVIEFLTVEIHCRLKDVNRADTIDEATVTG